MSKPLHPIVKWAQRKGLIFLEIGIRDIQNEKLQCTEKSIKFSCQSTDGKSYEFNADFYSQVVPSTSKWNKTGFHLLAVVSKKDTEKPYWPRLTYQSGKNSYIQCDWQKWIDEDEEQEEGNKGLGGLDTNNMQNFNDSDDEEEEIKKAQIQDLDVDKPIQEDPTGSSA